MAAVSAKIPDFLGGYSQKADFDKPSNTVNKFENVWPDFTFGTSRRPGSQLLNKLTLDSAAKNYKWFLSTIYPQPYLIAITNQKVLVWNANTGVPENVLDITASDKEYLKTTDAWRDIDVLELEKGLVILNRTVTVKESEAKTAGTLKSDVTSMDDLPSDPSVDDIYHVLNTNTADDDVFVKWNGTAWIETAKPNESIGLDETTMPHLLVKGEQGWAFATINYATRKVGEILGSRSNPHPSFVGIKINKVFGYLNRLGILAGANVVMSRNITPDNNSLTQTTAIDFYYQSTFTVADNDPIDINVGTVRVVNLFDVAPSRQGLALFAHREQFLLYSEQGVITPNSASVRGISTWEMDDKVPVVEIDSDFYFIVTNPQFNRYGRLARMVTRGMEEDPVVTEVSKQVSEWMPGNLTDLIANTQDQFVATNNYDTGSIYFYRRFERETEIVMENWFEWKFPYKVIAMFSVNANMYLIGETDDSSVQLYYLNLNQAPTKEILEGGVITNNILPSRPFLDAYTIPQSVTTVGGEVRITPPSTFPVIQGQRAVAIHTRDPITLFNMQEGFVAGFYEELSYNDEGYFVAPTKYFGDKQGSVVIGYIFTTDIEFPTYYYGDDYKGYLTIARFHIASIISGEIGFYVQQRGRVAWDSVLEMDPADFYTADEIPIIQEKIFTLPIHQRNSNFRLSLRCDTPYPMTLESLMWEGQYQRRSYRRV